MKFSQLLMSKEDTQGWIVGPTATDERIAQMARQSDYISQGQCLRRMYLGTLTSIILHHLTYLM